MGTQTAQAGKQINERALALAARMNNDARTEYMKGAKDKKRAGAVYDSAPRVRTPGKRSGRAPESAIIRTGSEMLDLAIGTGGIPRGHMTLVYGEYSSGKSQVALHAARNVTLDNQIAIYVDAEGSINDNLALTIGAIPENLVIWRPQTVEQLVSSMIGKGGYFEEFGDAIGLIVIDSIPMLPTAKELTTAESEGDRVMMDKARVWTERLQPLLNKCADNNTALIAINQLRDDGKDFMGNQKYKLPGGKVFGFVPSLYIKTSKYFGDSQEDRKEASVERKSGGGITKHTTEFYIEKNKVGVPYRKATVEFIPGKAYPRTRDIIRTMMDKNYYDLFGSKILLVDTKYDAKTGTLEESKSNFTLKITDQLKEPLKSDIDYLKGQGQDVSIYEKALETGYLTVRFQKQFMATMVQLVDVSDEISEILRDGLNDAFGFHGEIGEPDDGYNARGEIDSDAIEDQGVIEGVEFDD